jgi:DNA-binding response OmpR family regulator
LIAQKLVERVIKEVLPAYDLVGALSLTEARKKLRESTFDLILLDYILGDGSGLELIEEAKETPIIMITGGGV